MKRILLILLLQSFALCRTYSQSFTINDLLSLPSVSPKNLEHFMNKNGFSSHNTWLDDDLRVTSYFEKIKKKKKDSLTKRSVDIYKKDDTRYFVLHTTSLNEFHNGRQQLIKEGFFYDNKKDLAKADSVLFQKRSTTVKTICSIEDSISQYHFLLEKKELPHPDSVRYAEDLLKFNSHEYLVSFFGTSNVKKDLYYFTEKELKKCSVLFGNSSRQAVFVWKDEDNLCDLSFILVSNIIPTVSAEKFNGVVLINEWRLDNGIHPGMSIKELLKLNEKDFEIYGNQSAQAFMIKPGNSGKIDFKKTAIMLSCNNCNNERLLNVPAVSAIDVAEENLPMYVYYFIMYPSKF